MTSVPSQSLTEDLIGVIQAFGASRPTSLGLTELYQALIAAIKAGQIAATNVYNVRSFGATGNGVTDDTAAIAATVSAAAGGGIVYFPAGTYNASAQLGYLRNQIWQGTGTGSIIQLTTDLFAGGTNLAANFIVPGDSGGTIPQHTAFRDLVIQGPRNRSTYGLTPNRTIGVRDSHQFLMENCIVQNFFAGLEIVADHSNYFGCLFPGNYYNVHYSQATTAQGTHNFIACNLTSCFCASLHVEQPNSLQGDCFYSSHFGFGPVGILVTDGQNTTTPWDANLNPSYAGGAPYTAAALIACFFDVIGFEQIGNAAVLDLGTGSGGRTFVNGTIIDDMSVLWNAAFKSTLAPLDNAAYQATWSMVIRDGTPDCHIGFKLLTPGTVGSILNIGGYGYGPTLHVNTIPTNALGGGAVSQNTDWSNGMFFDLDSNNRANPGRYGVFVATTVVNIGDCVELTATPDSGGRVRQSSGTKPVFGVARTPNNAGITSSLAVQTEGYSVLTQDSTTSIAAGMPIYASSTVPGAVNGTATSNPVVGEAVLATGSYLTPTQILAKLRPQIR